MKKLLIGFGAMGLLFTACQKNSQETTAVSTNNTRTESNKMLCATDLLWKQQLAKDPSLLQKRMALEQFTKKFVSKQNNNARTVAPKIIVIPLVINVLYHTPAENISKAQIQSQIDVLNQTFGATNKGLTKTPDMFKKVVSGDIGIRFVLDKIVRKQTSKIGWGVNHDMKYTTLGGIKATDPLNKCNIWVTNITVRHGFSPYPGEAPEVDGIVVDPRAFGTIGVFDPGYELGITAVHEMGHWLNLVHTWGDADCGDDGVDDTPVQFGPHYNDSTQKYECPAFPFKSLACPGAPVEMTMNFMNYTSQECEYMFTAGQKARMLAVLAKDGIRGNFNK